ncbi:hypothetical protein BpHYR1_008571 [Brachionus plicatilis]|uniref:F5/8 type C domain-containing protein n=1 Tax=Brachionus plicatilis TaxID=10195 RepID=A0A3M7QX38_BRAPC|nr:hypothetical protein BpHYR1_008571 [Brachionus plicatilis]
MEKKKIQITLFLMSYGSHSRYILKTCNVRVMFCLSSAGWCFGCLDSTKAYIRSVYSKERNVATLSLGKIVNIGINTLNQTGNSHIDIFVAYRVSHLAKESDTSEITLTASINGADTSFVHTVTVAAAESQIIAPVPTVTTVGINNPVSIFQAFNITMIIDFPQDYNNFMEVESVPVHDTVDGLPRAKICSAVVTSSGENMPCPKCMNKAKLNSFSLNSSLYSTHDGMTWSLGSVLNFNLRTTNDNPEVNKITISVVGQILDHPSNVQGANISIPIGITFGNQTIWVSDNSIIIDNGPNYSLTNESLPTFSISTADTETYTAKIKEPRAIYFDMYTKPGSVYQEMDIEVLMPETLLGSNTPAATVCTVKLHYVGMYSTCAQQLYINEPANNHISYLQKMIKFKNDKAIVKLPALCNSAESGFNMDPIDGLLDDHPEVPSENYVSVGTKFTTDQIYIGSIKFTKSDILPMAAAAGVHSFSNLTSITASGSTFSPANLIVKIPPSSLFGYNLEASLITSSLSAGKATLCTIRILEQGNNVPCSNQLKHSFQYSEQLIRNYDFAIAGPICSINNISNSVNNFDVWDEDSVNFQILTRASHDAVGSYSVNLTLMDQFSNTSLKTEAFTFTLNPSTVVLDTPDLQRTNSSIFGVDPTDSTYVFVNSAYLNFFKGQTSIIRFNLTIDEPKSFETTFSLSNTQTDELEIIRLFTLYIGENFPCSSMLSEATFSNGSKYPYEIKINVGDLSFFETDPKNITSSTIYLEAQVRIPISSPISPEATTNFVLKPMLNNFEYPSLTQTLTVTVKDPTDLVSNVSELYSFTEQPGQQVSIRQSLKLNISLKIPPYSNCRTKIIFSCVDKTSGRQFCQINSTRIVSFGKNVDGLKNEYLNNLILTEFNRSAMTFYNDMAILDLGIVTNTHYSQKINSYEPEDDFLHFEADILVTDDQIAEPNSQFNFTTKLDLNLGQQSFDSHHALTIQRTQTERPYVAVNVNFLNDSSLIINSNSKLSVKLEIEHEINSNAEAYNVRFLFYLPTYISFSGGNNCSFNPSLNDTLITLALDRLHFGQKASCHFSLTFDQSNQYSSLMDQYGKSPISLKIPYVVFYEKYARSEDQETKFNTNFSFIEFKPPSISITSVPVNKLKSTLGDVACRMTSSVPEVVNVYNSGWKFGYRSHHWLKSLGSYVTISFVDQAKVSRIDFNQFNDDGTVTAFNEFRIAYSDDNSTFAHLPSIKTSTQLGQNFSYEIPNKFVQCRYLRIYITDVANRADLETKKTGFVINEIYGDFTPTTTVSCPDSKGSIDYAPRSFLYVDWTQKMYVCDETTDRSSSECYSSSNSAPTNWMFLQMECLMKK